MSSRPNTPFRSNAPFGLSALSAALLVVAIVAGACTEILSLFGFGTAARAVAWCNFLITFAALLGHFRDSIGNLSDIRWLVVTSILVALATIAPILADQRVALHPFMFAIVSMVAQLLPVLCRQMQQAHDDARHEVACLLSKRNSDGSYINISKEYQFFHEFLKNDISQMDWKSSYIPIIKAMISESIFTYLMMLAFVAIVLFGVAHAHIILNWLRAVVDGNGGQQQGVSFPARQGVGIGLVTAGLQIVRVIWDRSRRRAALCVAVAADMQSSLSATAEWADFPSMRTILTRKPFIAPIVVTELRPWLFVHPAREALTDLHKELLKPIVEMLDADHALSEGYAQVASPAFATASVARRQRFTGMIEDLAIEYFQNAIKANYRLQFYINLRRTFVI